MGKEEFLKNQSIRFDQSVAHPQLFFDLFGSVIVCAMVFGLYELICWIVFKLMDMAKKKNNRLGIDNEAGL